MRISSCGPHSTGMTASTNGKPSCPFIRRRSGSPVRRRCRRTTTLRSCRGSRNRPIRELRQCRNGGGLVPGLGWSIRDRGAAGGIRVVARSSVGVATVRADVDQVRDARVDRRAADARLSAERDVRPSRRVAQGPHHRAGVQTPERIRRRSVTTGAEALKRYLSANAGNT